MLNKIEEKDLKVIAGRATRKIWKQISQSGVFADHEKIMTTDQRIHILTEIEAIIIESMQNERHGREVF